MILGILGASLMLFSYRPASKPSTETPDVPQFAYFYTRDYVNREELIFNSWVPGMVEHKQWKLFIFNVQRISKILDQSTFEFQWGCESVLPRECESLPHDPRKGPDDFDQIREDAIRTRVIEHQRYVRPDTSQP